MAEKKAVIYCRVSTKEQVEEGNSLLTQERLCTEYARKNDYEIVGKYIEEGESAKTADRTELKKLLTFCANKKNGVTAVIIYKLDRLSRNTDDYSQLRILLKRYGVEIKSTSEHFENTPAGRFMENIIANVAQFDNDVRTERCIGGMREAIREGRYVWRAPIGYSNIRKEGKATIAPNEMAVLVKHAFEMVATNRHTIKEVQIALSRMENKYSHNKFLALGYLYRTLKNEVYSGWIVKFGDRIKGRFDPIVDEELFDRVQMVLKRRSHKGFTYRIENPDFPLRRFVLHTEGYKLTGSWCHGKTKKYPYYRFLGASGLDFRKEMLEETFTAFMNSFRLNEDSFFKLQSIVKEEFEKKREIWEGHKHNLGEVLPKLKEKQDILIQKNIQGIISDSLLRNQLEKVEAEIFEVENTLHEQPIVNNNLGELLHLIREFLQSPGSVWNKSAFNIKQRIQRFQFPHGVIFDGNEFRTPVLCNVFKVKDAFMTEHSLIVNLGKKITNTPYLANSSSSVANSNDSGSSTHSTDPEFWQKVQNDIVTLAEIIKNGEKENNGEELTLKDM